MTDIKTIDEIAQDLVSALNGGDENKIYKIGDYPRIIISLISLIENYNFIGLSKKKIVKYSLDIILNKYIDKDDIEKFRDIVVDVADSMIDNVVALASSPQFHKIRSSCCFMRKRRQ